MLCVETPSTVRLTGVYVVPDQFVTICGNNGTEYPIGDKPQPWHLGHNRYSRRCEHNTVTSKESTMC